MNYLHLLLATNLLYILTCLGTCLHTLLISGRSYIELLCSSKAIANGGGNGAPDGGARTPRIKGKKELVISISYTK